MKRTLRLLLTVGLSLVCVSLFAQKFPNYPIPQQPDTLRILGIGNSFTDDGMMYLPELLEAAAPWQCLSCMACEERCPRGVSPARVMEALRLLQIRQQGNNKLPAESVEHYPSDMPQQLLVAAFRKYNK